MSLITEQENIIFSSKGDLVYLIIESGKESINTWSISCHKKIPLDRENIYKSSSFLFIENDRIMRKCTIEEKQKLTDAFITYSKMKEYIPKFY